MLNEPLLDSEVWAFLLSTGRTDALYPQDLVGGPEVKLKSNYPWLPLQGQFPQKDNLEGIIYY